MAYKLFSPGWYYRYEHSGNPYVEPPNPNGAPTQGICRVPCPSHCEAQDMKTCEQDYDSQGCPMAEQCVPHDQECPRPVRDEMGCQIVYEVRRTSTENDLVQ